jgi:nucleotide-binding universal stress UspA family protein
MSGIVVGMDGSAHSHAALDWAMREAGIRQTSLTVMTVVAAQVSPWSGRPLAVPDEEEILPRVRKAVDDAVAKAASQVSGAQPTSVTVSASVGFPTKALVEASKDADLLVVGSRGTGGFGELLMGSVATQVAHHASCPVVIVPVGR